MNGKHNMQAAVENDFRVMTGLMGSFIHAAICDDLKVTYASCARKPGQREKSGLRSRKQQQEQQKAVKTKKQTTTAVSNGNKNNNKQKHMKTNIILNTNGKRQASGFTLIEMIGVLAVIAILAALLIPKVTSAISDAKINNTLGAYEALKTAVTDHYAKYNGFQYAFTTNASTAQLAQFDSVLMQEGLMDKPFSTKIGTSNALQVVTGGGNSGAGYKLDGANNLTSSMTYVVEAVIYGVAPQDAYDISARLDGPALTPLSPTQDSIGRCCFNTNNNTLYMFVTGR